MKFKLQSILDLRENMEKVKQRELGTTLIERQDLERQRMSLYISKDELSELTRQHMTYKVNIYELQQARKYSKCIEEQIQKKTTEITQKEQQIEKKKKELSEAVKQRKIIENLKEIKREEYLEEEKKHANNLIDELISYKYTAKERGD